MLEANEATLRRCRPDFFEKLINIPIDDSIDDKVELGQARDGSSILLLEREGQVYRLNSAFRPMQEADKWAAQYDLDHLENIILMFGMGNGIFVKSLLKRMRKSDILVIYEPSLSILQLVLEQEDISEILSDMRIHFVFEGINTAEFYFILSGYLDWRTVDALCICEHPGYRELFIKSCTNFFRQIADSKELVPVLKNTDVFYARRTVINQLINMTFIKGSNMLADFVGKIPEELPAIIVSAGPSLDKNIEELERAKGKAFILSTDSSVNILIQKGIYFDAMVTMDAKKRPVHICSKEECREIPLFCGFMSNYFITEWHTGKKIWIIGGRYIDGVYASLEHPFPSIDMGGSVATVAFTLCEKLGFKKIVLIGQDLAYGDGATHAGGVTKNVVNEQFGQQEVDAWDGGKVRSRYDWIIYRNWFENTIQQLEGIQVIDATEGGALIHGSERMTLAEVIEQYCNQSFDIRALLTEEPPTFDEETYPLMREKLLHLEKEMGNVRRSAEDAIIICDEVLNLIRQVGSGVSVSKQAKKLSVINEKIASQGAYQLLDYFVTDTAVDDLKDINQMTGNKEQDLQDTYVSAKAMYESLVQAVKDLKDRVAKMTENV